jgi:hypothetical protein
MVTSKSQNKPSKPDINDKQKLRDSRRRFRKPIDETYLTVHNIQHVIMGMVITFALCFIPFFRQYRHPVS